MLVGVACGICEVGVEKSLVGRREVSCDAALVESFGVVRYGVDECAEKGVMFRSK